MASAKKASEKASNKAAIKTAKKSSGRAPATEPAAKSLAPAAAAVVTKPVKSAQPESKSDKSARNAVKPPAAGQAVKPSPKPKVAPEKVAIKKASPKLLARTGSGETATLLDSQVAYEGPLFRVLHDHILEPSGRDAYRDVIRHNGSVVILAVDPSKKKKDPWIVIERQYRHAAGQFLWELPAGKLDAGEIPLDGAKRELAEETGYSARKWSPLVEYFASPGFLGEAMKVFLAEGLVAGDAHPEEDEVIDFRLVKLSELLELVDKGKIIDGKTLTTVLLYARKLGLKRK